MDFDPVVQRLTDRLKGPLPGPRAQAILAPLPRRGWPERFDPASIRDAAGLLLVFPIAGRAHLVLTVRSETLGRHGGQVSLPGGAVDPGESFEQAALREAHEEIALPVEDARPIGRLTPLDIPISGFRLHPVVATMARRPVFKPADSEVAGILEIAIADLCDRSRLVSNQREQDGWRLLVPAFRVAEHEIWGATAMVLAEFLALLDWDPQLS
jgi:8-oxo-dGTP pyrophosphatase MutT (NUDIX family)